MDQIQTLYTLCNYVLCNYVVKALQPLLCLVETQFNGRLIGRLRPAAVAVLFKQHAEVRRRAAIAQRDALLIGRLRPAAVAASLSSRPKLNAAVPSPSAMPRS